MTKENPKPEVDPYPDKGLLMAKATTIALGIVLLTLGVIFIILMVIK